MSSAADSSNGQPQSAPNSIINREPDVSNTTTTATAPGQSGITTNGPSQVAAGFEQSHDGESGKNVAGPAVQSTPQPYFQPQPQSQSQPGLQATARAEHVNGTQSTSAVPSTPAHGQSSSVPPPPLSSTASLPRHVPAQAGPSTAAPNAVSSKTDVQKQVVVPDVDREMLGKKRKWTMMGFSEDEQTVMAQSSTDLHLALLLDQTSTLYPSPPTAFTSYEDAVDRLVPYHVWQIYDDELDLGRGNDKGKEKEEREVQDASELVGRIQSVQERFVKVRRRETEHASLPSLISFLNTSTTILREELSSVQARLRLTRMEYNALHAEANKKLDEERRKLRAEEEARERATRLAEETARAKQQQLAAEQARAAAAKLPPSAIPAFTASSSPAMARAQSSTPPVPATAGPSTPQRPQALPTTSFAPSATPLAAANVSTPASTPSTVYTPERGRPRGRPRGRGRGGLREAVMTHTTASASNGATKSPAPPPTFRPTTASSSPGPAASVSSPASALLPTTGAGAGTPSSANASTQNGASPLAGPAAGNPPAQGPVSITVNLSLVPQLVALGLLVVPANPTGPKTPATVIRTSEDKKGVVLSINLSMCSKNQLLGLAKVLNVKPGTGVGGAAGASSPATPS